jgi:hypothetical protein
MTSINEIAELDLLALYRSHVENLLKSIWERCELEVDGDGDYPFRSGNVAVWVSVVPSELPAVRVWSRAVHDVRRTAKLLVELNEMNSCARWVRIYWACDSVVVESDLSFTSTNKAALGQAMHAVAEVADTIAPMLAIVHGGRVPLAELQNEETEEDAA